MKVKIEFNFPPLWVGKMLKGMRRALPGPAYDQVVRPFDALAPNMPQVIELDRINFSAPLSSPEIDREEEVTNALKIFAKRYSDPIPIAMALPGQSVLHRFLKLPPVESKRIPDIVRYEARQQIPFALEDVEWDYFNLCDQIDDEGFALENEICLVAAKRDQVARALAPFESAGLGNRIDSIQTEPLLVADMLWHDKSGHGQKKVAAPIERRLPAAEPVSKPCMFTLFFSGKVIDLVITNGERVWCRNIPIGNVHFVKAIAKELRMTHARARQFLQENSGSGMLREVMPVVDDLLGELYRSLGFFISNNRDAEVDEILFLGDFDYVPGLKDHILQYVAPLDLGEVDFTLREIREEAFSAASAKPSDTKPAVSVKTLKARQQGRSSLSGSMRGIGFKEARSSTLRLLEARVRERQAGSAGTYVVPLMAALQRLSYGNCRANLYPNRKTYAPKAKEAWGIEIGDEGIKCVRVALV